MGRPSKYTSEIAAEICRRLADGETLRTICRDLPGATESTVRGWVLDEITAPGFAAHYARARNLGLDAMADEILDIADQGESDRARLQVEARKWYLSKLAPKRYGERLELAGDANAPINLKVTRLDQ